MFLSTGVMPNLLAFAVEIRHYFIGWNPPLTQPQSFPYEGSELNKDQSLYGWVAASVVGLLYTLTSPEPAFSVTGVSH